METFKFDGLTFEIRKDKKNNSVIICNNTYICCANKGVKDIAKAFAEKCKKNNINASLILEYVNDAIIEGVQTRLV
jgi:hypothetical protein